MRRVLLCLLTLPFALNAATTHGQQTQKANRKAPLTCPAPTPGTLTQHTTLSNGDVMYYGRFLMYTPDQNSCSLANRQLRLTLPHLQNDDPAHPTSGNAPVIQATIEEDHGLLGNQMMLISIVRGYVSPSLASIQFAASVFDSNNKPTNAFYLNVTVIGHPAN